jgi:hypothetical protein
MRSPRLRCGHVTTTTRTGMGTLQATVRPAQATVRPAQATVRTSPSYAPTSPNFEWAICSRLSIYYMTEIYLAGILIYINRRVNPNLGLPENGVNPNLGLPENGVNPNLGLPENWVNSNLGLPENGPG